MKFLFEMNPKFFVIFEHGRVMKEAVLCEVQEPLTSATAPVSACRRPVRSGRRASESFVQTPR